MSKYRIAPDGADGWKIQIRLLGLVWVNVLREIGPNYYQVVGFDTEAEAEKCIDKAVSVEQKNKEWDAEKKARKQSVRPRSYP